jgi:acetyl-CoA carboxylase alpha subunit
MIAKRTTAADMARTVGIDPEAYRKALRAAKLPRKRSTDWEVTIDSPAYSAMRTVLASLIRRKAA